MANVDITYRLKYIPPIEMDHRKRDNLTDNDDDLKYYTLRPPDSTSTTGYFEVDPTPETTGNTFYIRFYKQMDDLDSYGDTTPVTIVDLLIDYAVSEIEKSRGNEAKSVVYETRFRESLIDLKRDNKRQVGEPEFLRFRGRRGWKRYLSDSSLSSTSRDGSAERYW